MLVVAEAKPSKEDLIPVIKKLHQNLAPLIMIWCVSSAMVRLPQKLSMWLDNFECDFCKSMVKPKVPLPAQPNRVHEFNHQTGIDVKNLRGWWATESED